MKIMIFRKNVLKQQDYLLHTETVGDNHWQAIIGHYLMLHRSSDDRLWPIPNHQPAALRPLAYQRHGVN
ncbi:hypothetical protein FOVSG1_007673 [Fusarium oxysporum f. sp. vasinfectum]